MELPLKGSKKLKKKSFRVNIFRRSRWKEKKGKYERGRAYKRLKKDNN